MVDELGAFTHTGSDQEHVFNTQSAQDPYDEQMSPPLSFLTALHSVGLLSSHFSLELRVAPVEALYSEHILQDGPNLYAWQVKLQNVLTISPVYPLADIPPWQVEQAYY